MLRKLLKMIGFAGKSVTKSVGKSMEFIDDTLEKEYITGTIDKAKELSGDAVQKAGEVYEKTKQKIETIADDPRLEPLKEKTSQFTEKLDEAVDQLKEKTTAQIDELSESPIIKNTLDNITSKVEEVTEKADKAFDKLINEEE